MVNNTVHMNDNKVNLTCDGFSSTIIVVVVLVDVLGMYCSISVCTYVIMKPLGIHNYTIKIVLYNVHRKTYMYLHNHYSMYHQQELQT